MKGCRRSGDLRGSWRHRRRWAPIATTIPPMPRGAGQASATTARPQPPHPTGGVSTTTPYILVVWWEGGMVGPCNSNERRFKGLDPTLCTDPERVRSAGARATMGPQFAILATVSSLASSALVMPAWDDPTFRRNGTMCVRASSTSGAQNDRTTFYALPPGDPPKAGWPVYLYGMGCGPRQRYPVKLSAPTGAAVVDTASPRACKHSHNPLPYRLLLAAGVPVGPVLVTATHHCIRYFPPWSVPGKDGVPCDPSIPPPLLPSCTTFLRKACPDSAPVGCEPCVKRTMQASPGYLAAHCPAAGTAGGDAASWMWCRGHGSYPKDAVFEPPATIGDGCFANGTTGTFLSDTVRDCAVTVL